MKWQNELARTAGSARSRIEGRGVSTQTTTTSPITAGHRHLLRLVQRDAGSDGWKPVSSIVFPLMQAVPQDLLDLEQDAPGAGGRARLTEKARSLMELIERIEQ